jgi:hypothetical protein
LVPKTDSLVARCLPNLEYLNCLSTKSCSSNLSDLFARYIFYSIGHLESIFIYEIASMHSKIFDIPHLLLNKAMCNVVDINGKNNEFPEYVRIISELLVVTNLVLKDQWQEIN